VLGAPCSRNSIVRCCTWVFIFIPCLYDKVFESAGILRNSYGYCPDGKMEKKNFNFFFNIYIWQEDEGMVKVLGIFIFFIFLPVLYVG
jgi:hypothetical protein